MVIGLGCRSVATPNQFNCAWLIFAPVGVLDQIGAKLGRHKADPPGVNLIEALLRCNGARLGRALESLIGRWCLWRLASASLMVRPRHRTRRLPADPGPAANADATGQAARRWVKAALPTTLAARPVYPRLLTTYRVAQLGSLGPIRDMPGRHNRLLDRGNYGVVRNGKKWDKLVRCIRRSA
jgi:hypothetical protein